MVRPNQRVIPDGVRIAAAILASIVLAGGLPLDQVNDSEASWYREKE